MLRAVIYCRCSTEEESQQEALKKQVEESRQSVSGQGWLLVDEYIEAKSGTTTANRREYNRLFEDILEDKFDVIQIKAQDRLMRNTRDWYLFIDRLVANGKRLYMYLEQKFYSADDALITGIKAILAEEYSKELSKKINNAHYHRQQDGRRFILPAQTYGLQRTTEGEVVLVEEEAEAIRLMFHLCKTMGCYSIERYLLENGVQDRNGKPFREEAIRRIIRNPIRCGTVIQNKVHFDFQLKKTVKVPQEEWVIHRNAVPAVVSEQEWKEANEAMDGRAQHRNIKKCCRAGRNPGKYQLSGKIFCGECKSPFYRTSRRRCCDEEIVVEWKCRKYLQQGRRRKEKSRTDIRESGWEAGQGCDNIHLEERCLFQLLEKQAVEYCEGIGRDYKRIGDKAMGILSEVLLPAESEMQKMSLLKEREKYELLQRKLLDKLLNEVITDEEYKSKKTEFDFKIRNLSEKLEGLQQKKDAPLLIERRLEEMKKQIDGKIIKKAIVELMVDCIEAITVYPGKLLISFRKDKIPETEHCKADTQKSEEPYVILLEPDFSYSGRKERELERIIQYMEECPTITARQIAEKEAISLSAANARIKKLKRSGKIYYDGAGGHGEWRVVAEHGV